MATDRDLTTGIGIAEFNDTGMVTGVIGDDHVLVVKHGENYYAIGAHCTHYHGPLADGLVVGGAIRCPWHHACFDLATGEATRAPALDPVSCWRVDVDDSHVFVREKRPFARRPPDRRRTSTWPDSVVIVGGGAAGTAAAEMLRREGYDRALTMVSAETTPPVDRPNLSKDYLSGNAPADWMPLRGDDFYRDQHIVLHLDTRVEAMDMTRRSVHLTTGEDLTFGALLIATGAEPVRLDVPGGDLSHVCYLRAWADADAIIKRAGQGTRVAVVGASFIGLEVAASLRHRGLDVHVIGPEARPLEKVLGAELGDWVRRAHESHGVVFHLGTQVASIGVGRLVLADGTQLDADFVVVGIGVRPRVELAERAGLAVDRGIVVDEYLQTAVAGVFAAGDVARWTSVGDRTSMRVEHWVVAERMGQCAARNMLGAREPFASAPFFWSQHYDTPINYVGHAGRWDRVEVEGSLEQNDCAVRYLDKGRTIALATIGRDRESLEFEVSIEQQGKYVK